MASLLTHHASVRSNQRGFPAALINLIVDFGQDEGRDRLVLDQRRIQALLDQLAAVRRHLLKLMDKRGATAVLSGGKLVTVYSQRRRRRRIQPSDPEV
ncbi:MAG: hypothetical protein IT536_05300 [Hyphomicrobiales bacterium]|nr:hypothetical protein [Hyphomicrobiales bacterium]